MKRRVDPDGSVVYYSADRGEVDVEVNVTTGVVQKSTKLVQKPAESTEGTKYDQEKVRLDLISPIALEELAKVLTFGAGKYGEYNWAKGIVFTRILGAILRHTFAYMRGESKDPETGLSHIAHAMANCMFLLHFETVKPSMDNREKNAYKKELTGV